jgi:serine/threonine protein kinase
MGPEQFVKKVYSRSVDVFATGIIMFMLLTGGQHPLFDSKTFSVETYRQDLLALS